MIEHGLVGEYQDMVDAVASGPEIYRPSRFWDELSRVNVSMLSELGLENFKRTVAQNYFNWLIISRHDNQFRSVLRHWLRHPTLRPLFSRMQPPDLIRTTIGLEKHIGRRQLLIYKWFVGMLWELTRSVDWAGLTQRLEEPALGNPIEIVEGGRRITQDLANSIREYCSILQVDRGLATDWKRVAELGAGYGRLAHVFLEAGHTRYFIFDIPPALYTAQWYLSRLHQSRRIFRFRSFSRFEEVAEELEDCEIAFFTPSQLELFPAQYFDIFLTISTLPEMSMLQVKHYLALMSQLTRRYIYLKQWSEWLNPADQVRYDRDSMRLDDSWSVVFERPDAVQTLFFERLSARIAPSR